MYPTPKVGSVSDFTMSPALGHFLATLNPYLASFKKVVEFVVVIVERVKVIFPIKLNQNSLFVVRVGAIVNDAGHHINNAIAVLNKHNKVACSQIADLTLSDHT
jgi:hypothetical protein